MGGTSAFYKVDFDGVGGQWTTDGTMEITAANALDTLLVTNGTLIIGDGGNDALAVYGQTIIASGGVLQTNQSLMQGTGTVTIDINNNNGGSPPSCANCIIEVNGTLDTVEVFDPTDGPNGSWSFDSDLMPTGRRTMVVGVVANTAIVIGGDGTGSGPAFDATEQYDPNASPGSKWTELQDMLVGRHGAAGGTIGGQVYVAAGGPMAGLTFSNLLHVFTPAS